MCPECANSVDQCSCSKRTSVEKGDGIVRVRRESKGRKGKTVTVIRGLALEENELKELGRALKAKCGTGGTTKNGEIEIQGDKKDLLIKELKVRGFTVKGEGG